MPVLRDQKAAAQHVLSARPWWLMTLLFLQRCFVWTLLWVVRRGAKAYIKPCKTCALLSVALPIKKKRLTKLIAN